MSQSSTPALRSFFGRSHALENLAVDVDTRLRGIKRGTIASGYD